MDLVACDIVVSEVRCDTARVGVAHCCKSNGEAWTPSTWSHTLLLLKFFFPLSSNVSYLCCVVQNTNTTIGMS